MILNKVKLEDFISHKRTSVDLGYGINVVVGPNGAGKTSILDAISFALFNDYSNRGRKENLINSRADRCQVTVGFAEGGVNYDVEWTMERSKAAQGSLFRVQDSERRLITRGGERAVVPEIEKILGIDKNMFLQSIYVRQGEIEKLVTARPAERKELISRLLGIEELQKAWETAKLVIQEYRERQIKLETELAQRADLENEKQAYFGKSADLEKTIARKGQDLTRIVDEASSIRTILDQLNDRKEKFDKLSGEKAVVEVDTANQEARLKHEQEELTKAKESEKRMKQLEDYVARLPFLDEFVRHLAEKDKQEAKQKTFQEKLDRIGQLSRILDENRMNHDLCAEKTKLLTEKRKARREYEGAATALQKALIHVADCEKDEKKRSADLVKELERCSRALSMQVALGEVEMALERKIQELQNASDELDERIKKNNESIGVLEQRIAELGENLSKFSAETEVKACPTCETELSPERVAELTAEFSSRKEATDAELAELRENLKATTRERKQIDQKMKKVTSIEPERVRDVASQLMEAKDRLSKQKAEAEQMQRSAEALGALDRELEELELETKQLEEASRRFDFAKRSLEALPSQEQAEAELKPIAEALKTIHQSLQVSLEKLGYEPQEPEKELAESRRKKEEYDQNAPIAKRRTEYESSVTALTQRLSANRQRWAEIARAIRELGYDREEHAKKQNEFDALNQARNSLEKEIAGAEHDKKAADQEMRKCEEELKILEQKAMQKKEIDCFIGILNRIREAYGKDGIQKLIRAQARPLLEKATRDLFERFNLAYSDIRIDDNYDVSVIGPSGEQGIDQISGGERVALAIALRLAVAQILSGKVETIVMDEPTTHLDEERRKELVNILNSFFREGGRIIPQMLIITHHREIEDVADIVYTVNKKEGYSVAEAQR